MFKKSLENITYSDFGRKTWIKKWNWPWPSFNTQIFESWCEASLNGKKEIRVQVQTNTIVNRYECLHSIAASSSSSSPVIAVKKAQKLHQLLFEWTTRSLLWYPLPCVEWKATSVTAGEFYGAVIQAYCSVLYESIAYADDSVVPSGN